MGSVVGEVVEIDGSVMEGGGQILRMSVCATVPCSLFTNVFRSDSLLFLKDLFGFMGYGLDVLVLDSKHNISLGSTWYNHSQQFNDSVEAADS